MTVSKIFKPCSANWHACKINGKDKCLSEKYFAFRQAFIFIKIISPIQTAVLIVKPLVLEPLRHTRVKPEYDVIFFRKLIGLLYKACKRCLVRNNSVFSADISVICSK